MVVVELAVWVEAVVEVEQQAEVITTAKVAQSTDNELDEFLKK